MDIFEFILILLSLIIGGILILVFIVGKYDMINYFLENKKNENGGKNVRKTRD